MAPMNPLHRSNDRPHTMVFLFNHAFKFGKSKSVKFQSCMYAWNRKNLPFNPSKPRPNAHVLLQQSKYRIGHLQPPHGQHRTREKMKPDNAFAVF